MPANIDGTGRRRIEWTGERCVPWADDLQVVYEHYHRYLFAAPQVVGRRVLDLGSGEGYGSALLAAHAREVTGVDIDADSIAHSRETHEMANLSFQVGDMLDLSFLPEASFDVVVCFEAVEHVSDQAKLLEGVARVLAPDGLLLASTPDRDASDRLDEANPFHVRELAADEFEALLRGQFANVRLWGQNLAVGSVLVPFEPSGEPSELATLALQPDRQHWESGKRLVPRFVVAAASQRELGHLALPGYSTLVDVGMELVRRTTRERDEARARVAEHEDEARPPSDRSSPEGAAEQDPLVDAYEKALQSVRRYRRAELRSLRRQDVLAAALVEAREDKRASEELLEESESKLELMTASAWFRLGGVYRRAVEKLVPVPSRRRKAYQMAIGALTGTGRARAAAVPSAPESLKLPPVSLPTVGHPEVTIVIPVHNNWALTAGCLASIAEDVTAVPYAVVVVDDASTDATPRMLKQVSGIEVVALGENGGFVRAVNAGITAARGRYVVLLNNDTLVRLGWLDALVDVAEASDDIGVVGAKLIYPDGRLQEAGGIIWQDGSGFNYGRNGDASDAAYNFRRDVDYCSGACLLVRREVLEATGGLDTRFAPAYYEDTDLAFSARRLGYRVVYEPRAVVVHLEGGSNGTDIATGTKRYQAVNREVFRSKWKDELASHPPADPALARVASWRNPAGRVLVVDEQVPTPNQDSGSRRMWEMLCILGDLGFGVTFLSNSGHDVSPYSARLRNSGIEVLDDYNRLPGFLKEVGADLSLALLCRPQPTWQHLPTVRALCPNAKIIYDTVDLHFVRERRRAEIEGDAERLRAAEHQRQMELALAKAADATLVVTAPERDLLLSELPELSVHVVPNIHRDEAAGQGFTKRRGLLFVGGFRHDPNRDAVHWLVEEILPRVREQMPEVRCYVVGSHPTEDIWALAGRDVRVLGWVEDLGDLYEEVRLFVAPLRYGAGMKGKVGESLAHGLPVVTTRIGAEGMGLVHDDDVLVAETADAFAHEVVRAYADPELWTKLAANGRRTISRSYSPDAVRPLLSDVLAEVGIKVAPASLPAVPLGL